MQLLTDENLKDSFSFSGDIELWPHQKAMLNRCVDIEESEAKYGIMNDMPGAGKTFVILALIFKDLEYKRENGKTIIVVPFNIFTQWQEAIKKCNIKYRIAILDNYEDVSSLALSPYVLSNNDILLTTNTFFPTIATNMAFNSFKVKRVV